MKSPRDMKVIQIEITNACVNRCSNCTRFCGHHRKPFFMDFATFKQSVQSMKGFTGVVGIMGGEPTIHPEFTNFVQYFREQHGFDRTNAAWQRPGADFMEHIVQKHFSLEHHNRRGLWSSITKRYADNFELIQDTFGYQCLNDHSTASMHQPLLVTRKELGISDEVWFPLRDACWVQNYWSASISPKGAFFCEIAAAMDMLLDGPGGWPIEPGWWEREPGDFGDQLHWCELCSAALPMPSRDARLGIDDISPVWHDMLQDRKSAKVRNGHIRVFDTAAYNFDRYETIQNAQPYLTNNSERLVGQRDRLAPKDIVVLPQLDACLEPAQRQRLLREAVELPAAAVLTDVPEYATEAQALGLRVFSPSAAPVQQLAQETRSGWILVVRNAVPCPSQLERFHSLIFNPGTLYWQGITTERQPRLMFFNTNASSLTSSLHLDELRGHFGDSKQWLLPESFAERHTLYHPSTVLQNEEFSSVFTPVSRKELCTGDTETPLWCAYGEDPVLPLLHWVAEKDKNSDIIGINGQDRFFLFGKEINPYLLVESDKIRRSWIKDVPQDMAHWDSEDMRERIRGADMALTPTVPVRYLCPDLHTAHDYAVQHCGAEYLQSFKDALEKFGYACEAETFWVSESLSVQPLFIMTRDLFTEYYAFVDAIFSEFMDPGMVCGMKMEERLSPGYALVFLLNIFALRMEKRGKKLLRLPYVLVEHGVECLKPLPRLADSDGETPLLVSTCGSQSLPFAGAWLSSLCAQASPQRCYDAVLLSNTITEEEKLALKMQVRNYTHVRLRIVDCSSLGNNEAYYRLHVADLLPGYAKALYTDPRTIFCVDPAEIFGTAIGDDFCAAVPHHFELQSGACGERVFSHPDVAVLLLNLDMLRNSDTQHAMYSALRIGKASVQSIITKTLDGIFYPLPPSACVRADLEHQQEMPLCLLEGQKQARLDPCIINFNNAEPLLACHTGLAVLFWKAARESAFYERLLCRFVQGQMANAPQEQGTQEPYPQIWPLILGTSLKERLFFKIFPARATADALRRSGAFDIPYYLAANPDVAQQGMDPVLHYVLHGWKEGRNPVLWFKTSAYLDNNPDVAASGMNPFFHYLVYGIHEARHRG